MKFYFFKKHPWIALYKDMFMLPTTVNQYLINKT